MNRSGDDRMQEFESYRQKISREFFMKYQNDYCANMPEHYRPLREAMEGADMRRLYNYFRRVRSIIRGPTLPPNVRIIPRPITVGTQTWRTTTFKPLLSENSISAPTENTADSKANTETKAESEAKNVQPNLSENKSALHKSNSPYKIKSKWDKTVGFNIVSTSGRYDYATVKRSVTPVFNAKPSKPFQ